MPGIILNLLGPPAVELPHGSPGQALRASKCLGLLAYLTLQPGPHPRERLAALLWGDSRDDAARTSLRQALKHVREAVGDALRVDRNTVELVDPLECDVRTFLTACIERPAEAALFDVPQFMAGFAVHHAPAFEEWLEATRADLRRRYEQVLGAVTREALASSHWRDAARAADRWLAADPLSDEAARLGAEADYMAGDRGAALARLNTFRERLARDLQGTPSAPLHALRRRIEQDGVDRRHVGDADGAQVPSFHARLVGRERQWRTLAAAWRAVAGGAGRVVMLEGEVGVGKTRLAEEFVRWTRTEGATVLHGRGYDPKAGIPYGPVVEALRDAVEAPGLAGTAPEWLTEVTRLLPELRRRFPGLAEPAAPTDAAERWRLFEAIAQVLLALAAEHPTVILVDDLQYCDSETCALLHFLTRRLEAAAVAIVVTVRLGELERDLPASRLSRSLRVRAQTVVLPVAALSEDEVWLLVRELGHITSPTGGRRFAGRIHQVTDGNPFHAIELLKTLFTQGLLMVAASGEWTAASVGTAERSDLLPMPQTVREAIAERVAKLPYEHQDLLATIAVSGTGCRTVLLSHAHGISRLHAAALCDGLVDRLLLLEDGGVYRCAHPVIAEVVRDRLTAARRREVHRAIALSLEAVTEPDGVGEVAGEVARHADRGGERALAYRFALLGSEEALRRYAFEEALSWLDLAADTAQSGAEVDAVNQRTADTLALAGWPEPPRRARRPGTPSRGITQIDLDLGGA